MAAKKHKRRKKDQLVFLRLLCLVAADPVCDVFARKPSDEGRIGGFPDRGFLISDLVGCALGRTRPPARRHDSGAVTRSRPAL